MNEFRSKDKVMMGSERRSMVMTDEEKKLTATTRQTRCCRFHCPDSDPIHKGTNHTKRKSGVGHEIA